MHHPLGIYLTTYWTDLAQNEYSVAAAARFTSCTIDALSAHLVEFVKELLSAYFF